MKSLIFIIGLTILCGCNSHKDVSIQQKTVSDSVPKPIGSTSIKTADSSNHIIYYSETKPSDEAVEIYKKTVIELNKQNVDFCELYKAIDNIAIKSNKIGDDKYPLSIDKANKYADKWFAKELHKMLNNNGISDKAGDNVWFLAHYFCPPKYK